MTDLMTDVVRLAHMLFFAIGIGSAVFLESIFLSRARVRVDKDVLALVNTGHRLICVALAGLWVTGLILVSIRTNMIFSEFSLKLVAKLAIVTVLTVNSFFISQVVNPHLHSILDGKLADLGRDRLSLIGCSVGLSAAGWLSALVLGAVRVMQTLPIEALACLLGGVLLAGAAIGSLAGATFGAAKPAYQGSTPEGAGTL